MRAAAPLSLAALAACGPAWAPGDAPSHPCPRISAAEFERAIADGATRGTVRVFASGVSDRITGPGVEHCATFKGSAIKPCRRPNDYVLSFEIESGESFYVRVEAGEEYRFRPQNAPNTCEILEH
ncbi:MAG: hypothetical protein JNJ73_08700 [Hyphomonadaceae bacterium]|nr:hypothetical protein [Hyphomonadaceae bacterium]